MKFVQNLLCIKISKIRVYITNLYTWEKHKKCDLILIHVVMSTLFCIIMQFAKEMLSLDIVLNPYFIWLEKVHITLVFCYVHSIHYIYLDPGNIFRDI